MSAEPTLRFGGTVELVGAGLDAISGLPYLPIIQNLLAKPAYFKLTVNSCDLTYNRSNEGSIDIDVEVMEDIPAGCAPVLRMSITEDNLSGHNDVNHDMLTDTPITVTEVGQSQNISMNFDLNAAWVESNLRLTAFVQNDASGVATVDNKEIMGGTTSLPTPDYSLRYYALGERAIVGDANPVEIYHYDWFRVYNAGTQTDNYTVSVAIEHAPANWYPMICEDGLCHDQVWSGELAPGEYKELMVELMVGDSGYGDITVTMTQDNYPDGWERTLGYNYLTNDLDILVVDDDGVKDYEEYYTNAIDGRNRTYGVWNRATGPVSAEFMLNYPIVVWLIGDMYPTVDADDKAAIGTYLDNGGNLFISGMDIGWELNSSSGDPDPAWYHGYLHATYISDDTNNYTLNGVPGDPISTGIDLVIQGGDGSDNQEYPSDIDPYDAFASVIWTYDATRNAAIKVDTGVYKVVYFAFGFEAIDNPTDRTDVMTKVLDWLYVDQADTDDSGPAFNAALNVYPNPVHNSSQVRFSLPANEHGTLQVYTLDGRLVRTLVSGELQAGNQSFDWDRTDASGASVPSGIYYYRLNGERTNMTRKVVLLK